MGVGTVKLAVRNEGTLRVRIRARLHAVDIANHRSDQTSEILSFESFRASEWWCVLGKALVRSPIEGSQCSAAAAASNEAGTQPNRTLPLQQGSQQRSTHKDHVNSSTLHIPAPIHRATYKPQEKHVRHAEASHASPKEQEPHQKKLVREKTATSPTLPTPRRSRRKGTPAGSFIRIATTSRRAHKDKSRGRARLLWCSLFVRISTTD